MSYKYNRLEKGNSMEKIKDLIKEGLSSDEIGFLLWHLEEIENFYPLYKTMLKKE
jgi:hypothetical protein